MANEIVEKSIRSLPVGYEFKIKPSKNIFFKKTVFSVFSLILVLLLIPLLVVFYYFFFLNRKPKKIAGDNILFLRNNLSLKRYVALRDTVFKDPECFSIVYDDFIDFLPNDDSRRKIPLSGYLPINPIYFIRDFFFELTGIFYDYIENSPEMVITDLYGFLKRLPHFILVKVSLESLIKSNNIKKITSFEMISRYSSLLNFCSKVFEVNDTVGYPHGLEYDIYYPNAVFGNRVFVTSKAALNVLSTKYPNKSFEIDSELLKDLFLMPIKFKNDKKLVYFTDSRNPDLDYRNIKDLKGIVDFIKLHPSDNRDFYTSLGVDFVDDFNEALSYRKAIVRSSTVVFEADLSGCEIYCLCTNSKEEYLANYLYPTIKSSSVIKIYNLSKFVKGLNSV